MNLAAKMTLDGSGFAGPLAGIQNQLGGAMGQLAAFAGVTLTAAGAILGFKNALDLGGELADLSARTGLAVRDLALLRQAFADAGVGADQVGPSIGQMQRALAGVNAAGQPTKAIFQQLGFDLEALKKKSPLEQLQSIGDRLMQLESPAARANAAMQIFGDSGTRLLAIFSNSGALDEAAVVLGRQADVLARNAGQFDRASDILGNAPVKLRGFFVGAAESLSASLLGPLERFNQADLTGFGQRVGKAIAPIMELVKDGRLGELLGAAVEAGFTSLAQESFWSGIAKLALAAFEGIGSGLLRIFTAPLSYLQAGVDWIFQKVAEQIGSMRGIGKATGLAGFKADSFSDLLADRQKNGFLLSDIGKAGLESSAARMKEGAADIKAAFKTGLDLTEKLKQVWGEGEQAAAASLEAAQNLADGLNATGDDATRRAAAARLDNTGDRLERIGGFIGGAGGPERDYARRTADNTGKLVDGIRRLADRLTGATPTAVWGDGTAFA